MSNINAAIAAFDETRTLQAAQNLEAILDEKYPDDPLVQECVEALARYRPGGGEFLFDEGQIETFVGRLKSRFKAVSMETCLICGRKLSVAEDPLSIDCGGDCWGCVGQVEADMGHKLSVDRVRAEIEYGLRLPDGGPKDHTQP